MRERVINFSDTHSREWLQRHIVWATCNGKVIEIINVKDDV